MLAMVLSISALPAGAAKPNQDAKAADSDEGVMSSATFKGLVLRGIGPAINSGRVVDIAVTPAARHRYFVAAASGGVWRTDNSGTTWTPIFDDQGSYSIGCLALDPHNPNVLWVGTGENNSQRSVSFGDGVYKTLDGGTTWTHLGLEESEHIGMIALDPSDTAVAYVAAQGPLWRSGGDRGLYKTLDGGASWDRVLEVSDDTGISEVHLDPRDPDVLYAVAYQRRRHVWTLINGGPESGIYKSTDAGATWRELTEGLPSVDLGRIGLAISPADPDVIYAIVEAARDEGGVFRSNNRGETWTKASDYMSGSPQYYNELAADPRDVDTVYSMDTYLHVSRNGGRSFEPVGEEHKHVDNHAMWIDPDDTDYLLVGCDGGVYESFDRGKSWLFKANLPITQFYRVTVDSSEPFYYVYGGTQDNNTLGGPSRTLASSGISNEDWFVTVGGDGYETQVDPTDPNILYSQSQYGGLVRYDRRSGERIDIQPQEAPDEQPHRWNWDSPLMISPHSPSRLYFACQRLFRSDDRGSSWRAVSPDLSRGLDRDAMPVMGRIWGPDAVSKNQSTSAFGNIVSLSESPLVEGLIYVGTDDGLIQVTEDAGTTWRRVDRVAGVPEMTYVSRLEASRHDPDTVYAAFDNHKNGDFTPYVFASGDRGRSWRSIRGDLPDREVVYALAQDHTMDDLLFAGTEFGLYFTVDGGSHWIRLTGGFPTIQVRDLDVHRGVDDLAVATFGRGFYILDDYSPLRRVSDQLLEQAAVLFEVREVPWYVEMRSRHMSRGHGFFTAPNPPYGAVFTYYLADGLDTRRERRIEAEKEADEADRPVAYPTLEELREEQREDEPRIVLTVRDADGEVVRRLQGPKSKGFQRVAWDLRYPPGEPIDPHRPRRTEEEEDEDERSVGPLALPGSYTVTLSSEVDRVITDLAGPMTFDVVDLELTTIPPDDPAEVLDFRRRVTELRRAVLASVKAAEEAEDRLDHVEASVLAATDADPSMLSRTHALQADLDEILLRLRRDPLRAERNIPGPPTVLQRVERIVWGQTSSTTAPTQTQRDAYGWASAEFSEQLGRLEQLFDNLEALESELEDAGGPWTPGRLPVWPPR
jgi:photosystem II stability/assembly factor-like uncharacterized protein